MKQRVWKKLAGGSRQMQTRCFISPLITLMTCHPERSVSEVKDLMEHSQTGLTPSCIIVISSGVQKNLYKPSELTGSFQVIGEWAGVLKKHHTWKRFLLKTPRSFTLLPPNNNVIPNDPTKEDHEESYGWWCHWYHVVFKAASQRLNFFKLLPVNVVE